MKRPSHKALDLASAGLAELGGLLIRKPIERSDTSQALVRAWGRSTGYSDWPKVAGELSSAAEKRGQRP